MKSKTRRFRRITVSKKSPFAKYKDRVVGSNTFGRFIFHEICCLLSTVGGCTGIMMRRLLYPRLLGKLGRNATIGMNVSIRCPGRVRLEDNVVIDDNVCLDVKSSEADGISIGRNSYVYRNSYLTAGYEGYIRIGQDVGIGVSVQLMGQGGIVIEDGVLIAGQCQLIASSHKFDDAEKDIYSQGQVTRGIRIGKGAWLGADVKVLDGVTIGEHSIIGASAVVNRDIPPYSIAVGVPAKVIRNRK